MLPLATEVAGISPVTTMDPKDVRLDVRVPGEELQADAAGVLVVRKGGGLETGVLVVLLVLVSLQHYLPLHHPVAGTAVVRRVQVLVVGGTGQVLVAVLLRRIVLGRLMLLAPLGLLLLALPLVMFLLLGLAVFVVVGVVVIVLTTGLV